MKLKLVTPTRLELHGLEGKELSEVRESLTYRDLKVKFELQKFKNSRYLQNSMDPEQYQAKLDDLKKREKVCLLNQDPDGTYWVLSGHKNYLETKYGISSECLVTYPAASSLPWTIKPAYEPYPYQNNARQALLAVPHARVEMGTGLGKSFILLNITRELGLKTVIMAPSTSIADQLYNDFVKALGKKMVGAYFDGKKEFKKLIVIGNAQTLTRVEPGSEAWEHLSQANVFMADESHQCPAATLNKVCTGLLGNAQYRYFFSATQIRNDGLDKLLDAITGKTVYEMTVREGVDQGYLSKPVFKMVNTRSDRMYESDDANEMTRIHLYYNPLVLQQAAFIINQSVQVLGHQVLVLIDEVEQFTKLRPMINHQTAFAHGSLQKCICQTMTQEEFKKKHKSKHTGNTCKVVEEYRESNPNDLVDQFNAGKFPVLVGTSCISTGTDIRTVKTMIYLKGGKSETEVKQGVGRCTRRPAGKTTCNVVDFDVANVKVLNKHALARREIFNDIYGPVEEIEWGGM